ncbi:MAG: hypothetical protein M0C28_24115 [Candidatus Moduliflexus flocculans]|nr:hypothetical protein [Candidatus Moduliflexus flocculans]
MAGGPPLRSPDRALLPRRRAVLGPRLRLAQAVPDPLPVRRASRGRGAPASSSTPSASC